MKHIVSARPVTTLYSTDARVRVNMTNMMSIGHACTFDTAVIAAVRRLLVAQYNRADIYDVAGQLRRSMVKHNKLGWAITGHARGPSMYSAVVVVPYEKIVGRALAGATANDILVNALRVGKAH